MKKGRLNIMDKFPKYLSETERFQLSWNDFKFQKPNSKKIPKQKMHVYILFDLLALQK